MDRPEYWKVLRSTVAELRNVSNHVNYFAQRLTIWRFSFLLNTTAEDWKKTAFECRGSKHQNTMVKMYREHDGAWIGMRPANVLFFSPIFSGVVWVSPGRDDCSLGFLFFCCQEWNLICRCSRSATRCDVMCILTRCSSRPGRNQRLFALPSPSCRLKPVCTVSSSPAGRVLFILLLPFTRYTMSVFHKVDILTSTRPKRETFT